jgi:hypothetical protein
MDAATRRKLRRAAQSFIFSRWQEQGPMIDDMHGLYSHTSDAYRAGKRTERQDFFDAMMNIILAISVKHETAGNDAAFHAVQECGKALRELKAHCDAPKHEQR